MGTFVILCFLGIMILAIIAGLNMSPEQRDRMQYGNTSPHMICPHCSAKGSVRTKPITAKKGISGGKATAALLTGGISMLATGLSRKENHTQAHCTHCNNTWYF